MKAIVVHNSDEVKDVIIGETDADILVILRKSKYWADIVERIAEERDLEEDLVNPTITLDEVTELYHDGDSQDGYTLLDLLT